MLTSASLVTGGNNEQMDHHLNLARQNGLAQDEVVEAITHLAFDAGSPQAVSAIVVARQLFYEECAYQS